MMNRKVEKSVKSILKKWIEIVRQSVENVCDVIRELNRHARIHGVDQICNTRHHPLERILWFGLVSTAFYIIFYFGRLQGSRFAANPTVISIERDYRSWNGTIPGLTFCYHNRFDDVKAQYLIERLWNIEKEDVEYSYFLDFLKLVANTSISSFKHFNRFANDKRFEYLDMSVVAKDVHPNINSIVSGFEPTINPRLVEVLTEKGICYSVNSILQGRLLGSKTLSNSEKLRSTPIKCSYRNFQCTMKLEVFDPTFQYTIHSPYDLITDDSLFTDVGPTHDIENTFTVTETIANDDLKSLAIQQRKCLFYDETFVPGVLGYSVNLCKLKCRAEAALKLCNCRPHFYTFINGTACPPSGLVCLSINSWPKNVVCRCESTCSELTYIQHNLKRQNWAEEMEDVENKKSTLRYEILQQKIRYRRNVLFSYEDLVVSLGAIASLFVGYNFWNSARMVYFIFSVIIKFFYRKFSSR